MVILIEEEMLSHTCTIFCIICRKNTKHELSLSREFYSCTESGCHSIVDIEIKEIEENG
jgi:hypothetical protein